MKARVLFVLITTGALVASCGAHHPRLARYQSEMLRAEVDVTKSRHFENKDWFVYGTLVVNPQKGDFAWLNLNCFRLKVGNRTSKAIYIDSPAWMPTDRQQPNPDHRFEFDVYWVIADLPAASEQESLPIELVYQPNGSQCFEEVLASK